MPSPLEVVRPHERGCRHCVEYDLNGNALETPGHYVCQHSECGDLADFTWPRFDEAGGTVPVLSCGVHALPVEVRDREHRWDCPAPDAGCVCSW